MDFQHERNGLFTQKFYFCNSLFILIANYLTFFAFKRFYFVNILQKGAIRPSPFTAKNSAGRRLSQPVKALACYLSAAVPPQNA
jgi:hypothetical protein